jgi:CheY-like chemotaxis protein/anti-sigma regulatory factor (Ser/Thr protein kinase)
VDAVVNAATEAASPLMVAARHEMTVTVPADPIWLYADAARLSQVVTNLLNNAARYTPRGGRISVQAGREGDRAVITVCDNGIGISPDALAGIFDLFMQAHGSEINEGGLGVGLALAKRLAEMHGGSIEAHSPGAGQGSAFIVRLPITQRDATSAVTDVEPPAARSAARLKVLIVDDSADLVEMLGLVVEGFGHDVRKTLDGRSAIAVALAYRPDVVLLDLGLPVISGEDVARELRRHPEMAATRLVALTGWGQAEDRRRTKDAGFDDHLTKPTDPRELQRLLADVARTR